MNTFEERHSKLTSFVARFKAACDGGSLDNSSEETIRTWINELLAIFGWDVQNTKQVLQERTLEKHEKKVLHAIGSHNTRPDYTLVNGNTRLAFIDAKSLDVNIKSDSDVAFQIRSYGWSIGASFSIVTNIRELAIYDCTIMPKSGNPATFALIKYLTIDELADNLQLLGNYLLRENVLQGNILQLRSNGEPADESFANFLGKFRIHLVEAIIRDNENIDLSPSTLTLWAQVIIDRILFIRVCEARGLEEDGLLLKFKDNGFWNSFNQCSYCDFYKHYDGPMFQRIESIHNLHIDDDVFGEMLDFLYYPSPYKFDVIPVKTISDIYDRFLSYSLEIKDGKVTPVLKDEYRKSKGAVTTPQYIVQNVIEQTVDRNYIMSLSIEQILQLRMVDIACGSGVFITDFYDFLVDCIKEKVINGETYGKNFAFIKEGEPVLTIEGKKEIICNCIYGVDIDQEAVEVAKMSLSLKVVDDYKPTEFDAAGIHGDQILSGIGETIKCGNSLVSEDILDFSHDLFDNADELVSTRIFSWRKAFPKVFENGGFDYVIGNPPYVEVKNYNQSLPTMAQYIKGKFQCSTKGKVDLSIPFIEKGLQLLNKNGRLGFIVQKRFFKTEYGFLLRKYVRERQLLRSVYDYEENNLFNGKITYVATIVLDRDKERNKSIDYCNSKDNKHISLTQDFLKDDGWAFSNVGMELLNNRLSKSVGCLQDTFEVQVGIQVLWVKAYHIRATKVSDGIIYGLSSIEPNVEVEVAACRHLVCNERFSPLGKALGNTFAIFPYDVNDDGTVTEIKFSDYCRRFPLAGGYLSKYKEVITGSVQTEPERNTSLDKDEYWHIYTRKQNLGMNGKKVVIPMTTYYPQASVITEANVYCDNANVNFIESDDADTLYAIAGIVNSRVFGLLARNRANPSSNGYAKYNKEFLKHVPFPNKAFKEHDDKLVELVTFARQMEQLKMRLHGASVSDAVSLKPAIKMLWNRIDEVCYCLYGLEDDEIDFLNKQEDYER